MSGIVGIVSLDGGPVDERLLRHMTDTLTYRGPDRQGVWVDGAAGFGHTLLRTTFESEGERQPASLDGRVWITADVRVDGRDNLIRELESAGRRNLRAASDPELILHAYHAWGERCVEHLLGDFAFAIWDGWTSRLFCARDHFGLKPFYYARIPGGLVFSNTLDCVRLHPEVGDGLNELALGDFLLFGHNHDHATTTFADVQRLPPAHSLTYAEGTLRTTRYWTLPTNGAIRYRRSKEYVDHFREILRAAIADRLRLNQIGVWMSGGLDSTSITATAKQILSDRGTPFELRAHTIVYDRLIPDVERSHARAAAEALGVDVSFFVADDYEPFDGWDQTELRRPEPSGDPFTLQRTQQLKQAALYSPVLLNGEGADEAFWGSQFIDLLGRMPLPQLGADLARSLVCHRRRPGAGIRSTLRKWLGQGSRVPPFPGWLNDAFAHRADLRERWKHVNGTQWVGDHPVRPEAYGRLTMAPWPWYFESFDPGVTRVPVEGRYPFLDLRLLGYLLAIPPIPWCVDKELLRVAMRGALPESIRRRPKAALAGDPLRAKLRGTDVQWLDRFDPAPELAQCVDRAAVPILAGGCDGQDPWLHIRPLSLNYWLRDRRPITRFAQEVAHGTRIAEFQGRSTCEEAL